MPTFKISTVEAHKDCVIKKALNKALSDVVEHHISLQKASKDNNID